jgi:hypothetical protein
MFPKAVVVDLRTLACESPFGVVKPGERGYSPLRSTLELPELDEVCARQYDTRVPTPAERKAALVGSMFGWDVPGADPAHYDREQAVSSFVVIAPLEG